MLQAAANLVVPIEHRAMNAFERLVVSVMVLDISIQIDTYLFYRDSQADFGAIGGINVSLATICLVILYGMWFAELAVGSGTSVRERPYINVPLTVYLGIAALSCVAAQDKQLSLNSIALFIQAYLICTYVANRAVTKVDITFIVRMLLVALAVQGAIMLGLRFVGHEVQIGAIDASIFDDGRVGGTIGSPNTAGAYLELQLPLALAALATSLPRREKLLAIVAFILGGIGLEMTLSRGAWIAVGLALPAFCLVAWYRRWISAWVPVACATVAILIAAVFHDGIANRIVGNDEDSARSRITLGEMAWQIIGDYPLLGVGTNNCSVAVAHYSTMPQFRGEWQYIIHNKYLLEWVELGAAGLAAFLWFSTLRAGWKVSNKCDQLLSPLALGLTVAIAGQMVHMMVEIFNSRPQVQSLWLCAGLIAAMGRVKEDD
jgi:hypothetical protein